MITRRKLIKNALIGLVALNVPFLPDNKAEYEPILLVHIQPIRGIYLTSHPPIEEHEKLSITYWNGKKWIKI